MSGTVKVIVCGSGNDTVRVVGYTEAGLLSYRLEARKDFGDDSDVVCVDLDQDQANELVSALLDLGAVDMRAPRAEDGEGSAVAGGHERRAQRVRTMLYFLRQDERDRVLAALSLADSELKNAHVDRMSPAELERLEAVIGEVAGMQLSHERESG